MEPQAAPSARLGLVTPAGQLGQRLPFSLACKPSLPEQGSFLMVAPSAFDPCRLSGVLRAVVKVERSLLDLVGSGGRSGLTVSFPLQAMDTSSSPGREFQAGRSAVGSLD